MLVLCCTVHCGAVRSCGRGRVGRVCLKEEEQKLTLRYWVASDISTNTDNGHSFRNW